MYSYFFTRSGQKTSTASKSWFITSRPIFFFQKTDIFRQLITFGELFWPKKTGNSDRKLKLMILFPIFSGLRKQFCRKDNATIFFPKERIVNYFSSNLLLETRIPRRKRKIPLSEFLLHVSTIGLFYIQGFTFAWEWKRHCYFDGIETQRRKHKHHNF